MSTQRSAQYVYFKNARSRQVRGSRAFHGTDTFRCDRRTAERRRQRAKRVLSCKRRSEMTPAAQERV